MECPFYRVQVQVRAETGLIVKLQTMPVPIKRKLVKGVVGQFATGGMFQLEEVANGHWNMGPGQGSFATTGTVPSGECAYNAKSSGVPKCTGAFLEICCVFQKPCGIFCGSPAVASLCGRASAFSNRGFTLDIDQFELAPHF